jgi:hypothetical protein
MGGGVGLHVIPAGSSVSGVGDVLGDAVGVAVGVAITTTGVRLAVGEDEFAPQWTSKTPAIGHAPRSNRGLSFIRPPATFQESRVTLERLQYNCSKYKD